MLLPPGSISTRPFETETLYPVFGASPAHHTVTPVDVARPLAAHGAAASRLTRDEPRCRHDLVIEDGADADPQHQLGGYWFSYADNSGSSVHPPPATLGGVFSLEARRAEDPAFVARMFGVVGNSEPHFVGMGFNFSDPREPFDASAYRGFAFLAKGGAGATTNVRVSVLDGNTDPQGELCDECYNAFGFDLELTPEWRPYTLYFAQATQEAGWGKPRPESIDPQSLYAVQFQVTRLGSFEVSITALSFLRCDPAWNPPGRGSAPGDGSAGAGNLGR